MGLQAPGGRNTTTRLCAADLLDAGVLPRIHGIGPASTRIILEVLEHGFSPTVEHAIVESGQQNEIARRRALRTGFLSRAEVVRLIALEVPGIVDVKDYRGDCQMHSVWSDGVEPIAQMAESAMARLEPNRGDRSFEGAGDRRRHVD